MKTQQTLVLDKKAIRSEHGSFANFARKKGIDEVKFQHARTALSSYEEIYQMLFDEGLLTLESVTQKAKSA